MALSVVDVYQKILPKTNCGDCGYATCLAFASMVVSEKLALSHCPHVDEQTLAFAQAELDAQHVAGKWTKRDMAADALRWARERAATMRIEDLAERLGGRLIQVNGRKAMELAYFDETINEHLVRYRIDHLSQRKNQRSDHKKSRCVWWKINRNILAFLF